LIQVETKRYIQVCKGKIELILRNKSKDNIYTILLTLNKVPVKSNLAISFEEYKNDLKPLSSISLDILFEIKGWFNDSIVICLKIK